jgi:hypothetical protein
METLISKEKAILFLPQILVLLFLGRNFWIRFKPPHYNQGRIMSWWINYSIILLFVQRQYNLVDAYGAVPFMLLSINRRRAEW